MPWRTAAGAYAGQPADGNRPEQPEGVPRPSSGDSLADATVVPVSRSRECREAGQADAFVVGKSGRPPTQHDVDRQVFVDDGQIRFDRYGRIP